jgi:hypothetical protein
MNYFKYVCISEFDIKLNLTYSGQKRYKLDITFHDYSFNHKLWSWKKFNRKVRRRVKKALVMQITTVISQYLNTSENIDQGIILSKEFNKVVKKGSKKNKKEPSSARGLGEIMLLKEVKSDGSYDTDTESNSWKMDLGYFRSVTFSDGRRNRLKGSKFSFFGRGVNK